MRGRKCHRKHFSSRFTPPYSCDKFLVGVRVHPLHLTYSEGHFFAQNVLNSHAMPLPNPHNPA